MESFPDTRPKCGGAKVSIRLRLADLASALRAYDRAIRRRDPRSGESPSRHYRNSTRMGSTWEVLLVLARALSSRRLGFQGLILKPTKSFFGCRSLPVGWVVLWMLLGGSVSQKYWLCFLSPWLCNFSSHAAAILTIFSGVHWGVGIVFLPPSLHSLVILSLNLRVVKT